MTSSALWFITAMKHTNTVTRYPGTASELANEIGDLYYNALANHLHLLAQKNGQRQCRRCQPGARQAGCRAAGL